jgi:hypothetical protein
LCCVDQGMADLTPCTSDDDCSIGLSCVDLAPALAGDVPGVWPLQ